MKQSTLEGLRMYADHGIPPGDFLRTVLENNLKEANMYKSADLFYGSTKDSKTDDYDRGTWAYLDHSCDDWVIGGLPEIDAMIKDLTELKKKLETGAL